MEPKLMYITVQAICKCLWTSVEQMRRLGEVEPPGAVRYLIGALIMMVGVVLPLGYMMFRTKRGATPTSATFGKQTKS
ncbi:hypothetical protein CBR_g755 [Chara braunii]|uniref:Uncharacterized protein n=1 Tax=Chara braunii TaxID=69332 RepID=A0A388KC95_CHABU|nr:hypothetical protein CBR_g755 [Chara braunii]|eukprot:GBG67626.1 hypothetical protein CBR_g755 [Chara braunii]